MATKKPTNQETNQQIIILAIESSCDETASAVVQKKENDSGVSVLSSVTATSLIKHKETKGIVPEVAAREQLKYILPVIQGSLKEYGQKDFDAIAVTTGPGLVGSLLVGIETARALAMAWNKPIIPVNHILAHPYANFIKEDDTQILKQVQDDGNKVSTKQLTNEAQPKADEPMAQTNQPSFPLLSWVISGGHTELYLMKSHDDVLKLGGTVDDAAGECFDKCARVLGFDYPGGPYIERIATELLKNKTSNQLNISLPRPLLHEKTFNVSFSGLKTAFLRTFNENKDFEESEALKQTLAYELQEAVTDIILKKTKLALSRHPEIKSVIVSGGVAANKRLKEKMEELLQLSETLTKAKAPTLHFPNLSLCTDNAAMIGAYASFHMDKSIEWSKIKLEL